MGGKIIDLATFEFISKEILADKERAPEARNRGFELLHDKHKMTSLGRVIRWFERYVETFYLYVQGRYLDAEQFCGLFLNALGIYQCAPDKTFLKVSNFFIEVDPILVLYFANGRIFV